MDGNRKTDIINEAVEFVKCSMLNAESGHNWSHVNRVWILSKKISKVVPSNCFIVELGALFHDIADHKFCNNDKELAPAKTRDFLDSLAVDQQVIDHVVQIVKNVSWSNRKTDENKFHSVELDIVQDADRLDAIGAIGIARAFHYGGFKNNEIYNPDISPNSNSSPTTIDHFYEKLLLIKNKMNTDFGKEIASQRHEYMQNYLKEFYLELDFAIS